MSSRARKNFEENRKDVYRLWEIHELAAAPGAGRKHGVEVLNRSAIVFVNACWEAFIEDLARGVGRRLTKIPAEKIPEQLKAAVGEILKNSKNPKDLWSLAGEGWKTAIRDYVEDLLAAFNTPKTENIDKLFKRMLGIKKLSADWSWQGMSPTGAASKLDRYVSHRGAIVHRGPELAETSVHKSWGIDFLRHVERLVEATEETVRAHLEALIGKSPWST